MSQSLPHTLLTAATAASKQVYEDVEAQAARLLEKAVASNAFGELLALTTANTMAALRLGNAALDRSVGALRLAGRVDLTRLGVQQARTEDKLEAVLQAVERLEATVAALEPAAEPASEPIKPAEPAKPAAAARSATPGTRRSTSRVRKGAS